MTGEVVDLRALCARLATVVAAEVRDYLGVPERRHPRIPTTAADRRRAWLDAYVAEHGPIGTPYVHVGHVSDPEAQQALRANSGAGVLIIPPGLLLAEAVDRAAAHYDAALAYKPLPD